jgi:hypothetical protein
MRSEGDANVADPNLYEAMAPLSPPAAAAMVAIDVQRERIVRGLRERADWLRSEYLNGGDFKHLKAREDECRYIAEQVEKGRW